MGIVRFDIELDNPGKTYQNGSVLSGKVHLVLDSPKSVTGLKITVYGQGRIYWSRGKQRAELVEEVYVNEYIYLLGSDGPTVIPEGKHVYPFSYKLPETIPNSYKDEIGTIGYKVKAVIQRVWYLWNHRESTDFAVVVPLDLNGDYKNAEPDRKDISQTFMGCSHPVRMSVTLPVRGYIPGQTMPVTVDIKNEAEVHIKGVCFSLIKLNLYHGRSRTRRDEVVLADFETPMPESSNIETRIKNLLHIPLVQPSGLRYSNIIDLEYLVRIEVRVGGLHRNFDLDVPIIIGTTPLLASTVAMTQGALPL